MAGGSGSGKSCFVQKLVEKDHFQSRFENIKYIYPSYLDESPMEFKTETPVESIPGLPDCNTMNNLEPNSLVILDDLMVEVAENPDITRLFCVIARKKRISIILIVQNIFMHGRAFRTIRLNATGICMFKFYSGLETNVRILRDLGLTKQVPRKLLDHIYSSRFHYIYLDLHPNRHSDFCSARGNIFDEFPSIYCEMEYVAISKADFLKYFKIIESKKGKIRAIKNELTIAKRKRDPETKDKVKKRRRQRTKSPSPSPPPTPNQSEESEDLLSETDESSG